MDIDGWRIRPSYSHIHFRDTESVLFVHLGLRDPRSSTKSIHCSFFGFAVYIMTPPLGRDERTLSLTSLPPILARILVANESEQKVSVFIRI